MDNTMMILCIIAAGALAFAAGNGYGFLLKHNRTATVEGHVYSISMTAPKKSGKNSKWAKIAYTVNGKKYISQTQIQVPLTAEIGTKITVRYDTFYPQKLYHFSLLKIIISLAIAILCIIAIIFLYIF